MKYFSTFTGIGGFEIGIQNAYRSTHGREQDDSSFVDESGERLQSQARQGTSTTQRPASERPTNLFDERPLCVGYSEIDKYATSVYERHFKGVRNYGDITKINAAELPDFDCLVGGFPCQAFSIAGKRGGFADTRGTLFFDLARILKEKQPRLFVFENVKGLLSHDNGRTFTTIIATIDELGYDCQWQVLNSKDFGVPQNRERVIIVGHLRGTPRPEVFPFGSSDEKAAFGTVTSVYHKGQHTGSYVDQTKVKGHDTVNGVAHTIDANYYKGLLANQARTGAFDGNLIRRLTPMECERLQAFPDDWTRLNADDQTISDTQRYKMCGNAVTTNVIQAVFERIFSNT